MSKGSQRRPASERGQKNWDEYWKAQEQQVETTNILPSRADVRPAGPQLPGVSRRSEEA